MMMHVNHLFILNHRAGRAGVHEKLAAELTALCRERGEKFSLCVTDSREEAEAAVHAACADGGETRIYACGGDGTFGGVVNVAARYAGAAVGVIPIGTGNDFVRNFGGKTPFLDPAAQLDGQEIRLDLLRCNDRVCANMVNIGFDCEVVKEAVRLRRKKVFGEKLAYISGVLLTLIRKPGVELSAALEDETPTDHKLLLIAVANGAFCGGGFRAAPESRPDDGQMDVLMVENMTRTRFLSLVKAYHDGTYLDLKIAEKIITYRKGKQLSLKFPEVRSVCIDGELSETDHLDIGVLPGALRFILPRGAVWAREENREAACSV
ncbi:MAG: hypothetical protein IJC15_03570 [Clostridia bacterium]|nr:hypothetical protein [Clostridia bacterium]